MSERLCPHDGRLNCPRHKRRPSKNQAAWGWAHQRAKKVMLATSDAVCFGEPATSSRYPKEANPR